MANLRDIKRRITSVKSTQKITRAMKMVAASKLRRAQASIVAARPYAYHMRDLVNSLAARAERDAHPLLRPAKGEGAIALIVITSDRGLCGGFNANIVNRTLKALRGQFAGRDVRITAVGRKGHELLKRRGQDIAQSHTGNVEKDYLRLASTLIDDALTTFRGGEVDEVWCIYNEFKSAVQQEVTLERLLPFVNASETGDAPVAAELDYLYEPNTEAVFEALLNGQLRVQLRRMLYESVASEYGARMTAMDAATRNAGDVIGRLTLAYNRARQNAITTELIEVISGAEAL